MRTSDMVNFIRRGERAKPATMRKVADRLVELETKVREQQETLDRYKYALEQVSIADTLNEYVGLEETVRCVVLVANNALNGVVQVAHAEISGKS
ncbi:MAG: hypothetical protein AB7C95_00825 [Synergistaceae bacterium]